MNWNNKNLRKLLDEVMQSGEHCGPSRADVSAMLRNERHRRHRLRTGAAVFALIVLASSSLLWRKQMSARPAVIHEPAKSASIILQEVNDDQLLTLLQDMPAALMEWPNGDRTLLVVEQRTTP